MAAQTTAGSAALAQSTGSAAIPAFGVSLHQLLAESINGTQPRTAVLQDGAARGLQGTPSPEKQNRTTAADHASGAHESKKVSRDVSETYPAAITLTILPSEAASGSFALRLSSPAVTTADTGDPDGGPSSDLSGVTAASRSSWSVSDAPELALQGRDDATSAERPLPALACGAQAGGIQPQDASEPEGSDEVASWAGSRQETSVEPKVGSAFTLGPAATSLAPVQEEGKATAATMNKPGAAKAMAPKSSRRGDFAAQAHHTPEKSRTQADGQSRSQGLEGADSPRVAAVPTGLPASPAGKLQGGLPQLQTATGSANPEVAGTPSHGLVRFAGRSDSLAPPSVAPVPAVSAASSESPQVSATAGAANPQSASFLQAIEATRSNPLPSIPTAQVATMQATHGAITNAGAASSSGQGFSSKTPEGSATASVTPSDGSEAAAFAALSGARLLQSFGRAAMQVHVHAEDFGRVSVQAAYGRDAISAQITLQNSDLSSALSAHVPAMEQRLGEQHGLRTSITVDTQSAGMADSGMGGREQRQGSGESATRAPNALGSAPATTASLSATPTTLSAGTHGGRRLDIHI